MAAGSLDTMVRVWNVATGVQLERLKGHKDSVYSWVPRFRSSRGLYHECTSYRRQIADNRTYRVAFSPDGKCLVSGSLDRTLRVWDLTGTKRAVEVGGKESIEKGLGTCQSTLNGHKVGPLSTGLAPARPVAGVLLYRSALPRSGLAVASQPARTQPQIISLTLNDFQDYVLSVAISPDGQWVVSGSKDRSIQFWNIASGQAQFMLQGHKNSVISIDLARSGGYLASGSGDCQARIWKYESQ